MELGERKRHVLRAVIETYIRTGEPIGSKAVVDQLDNAVSSATIRNDMAELSARGYLFQPHTSAGRIPTVSAFRLYIDHLMPRRTLDEKSRREIDDMLENCSRDPEKLVDTASKALAEETRCAAVTTTPWEQNATVQRIELTGEGDTWTYTFRRLPTMDAYGQLYQYRVREEEVDGYTVQYNGYTITNIHAAVTPTPEPTPEPTPTPTPTPLPTPQIAGPTPERAVGMRYIDGEWFWIDDSGVPLGVVAQTGDSDNLTAVLLGLVVLVVLAGVLAITIIKKEKKKKS